MNEIAPAGATAEPMMENCYGHFVPERLIKPEHKLEDQLVRGIVERADGVHALIVAFKEGAFTDVRAFLTLLAEKYGVRLAGQRGGVQLHSFDGMTRVTISVADSMTFGPELKAAKALIDQCITAWSAGANANLRAIVDDAFSVGDGGALRVDRILGLRRLSIDDPVWTRAMEAIGDALRVTQTREYVRVYRRPTREAEFEQVVLDVSRV